VLGLIAERPRHGYAVRAAFEERLSDFGELNYGQVYQMLMVLEREGLIVGAHERVEKRTPRTVSSITASATSAAPVAGTCDVTEAPATGSMSGCFSVVRPIRGCCPTC
jgi:hypothetical protein